MSLSRNQAHTDSSQLMPQAKWQRKGGGGSTHLNFGILKGFGAVLGRAATSARAFCMSWMACTRTVDISSWFFLKNYGPHGGASSLLPWHKISRPRQGLDAAICPRAARAHCAATTRWAMCVAREREKVREVLLKKWDRVLWCRKGSNANLDVGSVVVLWAEAHALEGFSFVCHCSRSVRTSPLLGGSFLHLELKFQDGGQIQIVAGVKE